MKEDMGGIIQKKEDHVPILPSPIHWDELDKTRYYIFGPTLFLGVRAAVYPSILVKTRLQVQQSQYKGNMGCNMKKYVYMIL